MANNNVAEKAKEFINKFSGFIKTLWDKNKRVKFESIKIGNQIWMSKNLTIDDGGSGIVYNKNNGEYYYTWDAAKRIACNLSGWHLPTCEEWNTATEVCGGGCISGGNKNNPYERSNTGRNLKNKLGVKLVGFHNDCLRLAGYYAIFWTAMESSGDYAYRQSFNASGLMECDTIRKSSHYTVRLVKD